MMKKLEAKTPVQLLNEVRIEFVTYTIFLHEGILGFVVDPPEGKMDPGVVRVNFYDADIHDVLRTDLISL